jgi:Glycosyl hydrolase-like 10
MKTLNIRMIRSKNSWAQGLGILWIAGLLYPVTAQPVRAQPQACQLSSEAIAQTSTLQLRDCRQQNWPQTQAIWLRLYPCDVRPGRLDDIFDRILSRGYNQVYLEVFSDGQVLLPSADNRTAWSSVIWQKGYENRDLLAEAIAKGRNRGIKVYSWMFALNFGYTYSLRPGADQVLARNGKGQTSLSFGSSDGVTDGNVGSNETFVDPYNLQAQRDYYTLVQAILKRQPDGVLFDYVRYPRGVGSATIASKVQDLWIYGTASQEALIQRAQNERGRELIRRYLAQGSISSADVTTTRTQHPQDKEPIWQGRTATSPASLSQLQGDLWRLSITHAFQGVLDFLAMAIVPVQQRGIPAGAVFFPAGNQKIGAEGYDARLQPWDQFPSAIEWHPMAYSTCGDMSCIVAEIQRVMDKAPAGTQVIPALAGTWGNWYNEHPPLEWQMLTVQRTMPQINAVSHFAFSWQDAGYERDRKTCRLQ